VKIEQVGMLIKPRWNGKNKGRSTGVDLPFVSNDDDDNEANRDDGCPHARVPRPSTKDGVNRPRSTVHISEKKVHRLDSLVVVIPPLLSSSFQGDTKRKRISRLDEIKRRQQERKRHSKPMSIVTLIVEGNRTHL
jgi:hypothetical protein